MEIFTTRRSRLHLMVEQFCQGNVTEFAKRFGYSRSQIYQFLSKTYNDGRSMGERAARELEKRANMPSGWLDRPMESLDSLIAAEGGMGEAGILAPEVAHARLGIPVLGNVTANKSGEIVDATQILLAPPKRHLQISFQNRDLFALRVTSFLLSPRIKSLEYVVIERNVPPRPGDDVLVRFVTGEWYIVQFLYERNDDLYFGPINDPRPTLAMPERAVVSLERIVMIVEELDGSIIET